MATSWCFLIRHALPFLYSLQYLILFFSIQMVAGTEPISLPLYLLRLLFDICLHNFSSFLLGPSVSTPSHFHVDITPQRGLLLLSSQHNIYAYKIVI